MYYSHILKRFVKTQSLPFQHKIAPVLQSALFVGKQSGLSESKYPPATFGVAALESTFSDVRFFYFFLFSFIINILLMPLLAKKV